MDKSAPDANGCTRASSSEKVRTASVKGINGMRCIGAESMRVMSLSIAERQMQNSLICDLN